MKQKSQPQDIIIEARAYNSKALVRPNTLFVSILAKCYSVCHNYIPNVCVRFGVSKILKSLISYHVPFDHFTCKNHKVAEIFVEKFVQFYILNWVKNINMILRGTLSKNINDNIKRLAQARCIKYKMRKEKMRRLKGLG